MLVFLVVLSASMVVVTPFAWAASDANPQMRAQIIVFTVLFTILGAVEAWLLGLGHVGSAGDRALDARSDGGRQEVIVGVLSFDAPQSVEISRRPGWQGVPKSVSRPVWISPSQSIGEITSCAWPTPLPPLRPGAGCDSRTLMACSEPSSCAARTGSPSRSRMFMYVFAKAIVRLGLRSRRTECE